MNARKAGLLAVLLMFFASHLQAQNTQWTGSQSTSWRNAANWNTGVVPGSSSKVIISTSSYPPYVPAPLGTDTARTGTLTIQSGAHLYFDSNPNPGVLVVYGTQQLLNNGVVSLGDGKIIFKNSITFQNGGTFDAGSGSLNFQGVVWNNSTGSSFIPGTSTVTFSGAQPESLIGNISFYNLQLSNTSGAITLNGNITIANSVTLDSGVTVSLSSGSLTIDSAATLNLASGSTLVVNGTFNNNGTVTGNGTLSSNKPFINTVTAANATTVNVLFSEAVGTVSAQNIANYSINKGAAVNNATRDASNFALVHLSVSSLASDTIYTLTVNNVVDEAGVDTIAVNSKKNFSFSAPPPNLPPAAPGNLSAISGNQQTVLIWSKNTELDFLRYRIYGGTSQNSLPKIDSTGNIADTSKTITGLINGTTYYFRVTAVDSAGNESSPSADVSVTPGATVILHLDPINISMGSVNVNASKDTIITISGLGDDTLHITQISSSNPAFSVRPTSIVLPAGQSTKDTIRFSPTVGGDASALLIVASNAGSQLDTIRVSGSGNAPPAAPQGLVVTDSSSSAITLLWRKNTEPDLLRYRIYLGTSPNPVTVADSTGVNDTTRTFTGLTNGVRYYVRLTAVDNAGNESAFSDQVSSTPQEHAAPAAPTGLVVTDSSSTTIAIRWNQSSSANFLKYRIYRGTSTQPTTLTDSLSSRIDTGKVFTGLTNGIRYYFRITVVDSGDIESGYSNEVNAMPADRIAPSSPADLAVVDSSSSTVGIIWRKSVDADFLRYRIYRGTSPNSTAQVDSLGNRSDTSRTFTGLANGVRYYFLVTVLDSVGNESAPSNEVSATPSENAAPAAPMGLVVVDSSSSTIEIRWRQSVAIRFMRYRIYRDISPNPTVKLDSTSGRADTSKVFTGLTDGTRYYFRVTTVDSAGVESGYSNEVNAMPADRVAPAAVTGLVVVDSSSSRVEIRWNKSHDTDFLKYRIYSGTSAGPSSLVDSISSAADTTRAFTGLTNGTRYYFRVCAVDSAGNSGEYSNEVNAMPADRIAPAPPSNLAVVDSSSSTVGIVWKKNTDMDFLRYRIYRSTSHSPTTQVDSSGDRSDTSKTFIGLTNGVRYYFLVTALDSAGNESAPSNEVSATPSENAAPAAPTGLTVVDSSSLTIEIRWRQSNAINFLKYRIYRSNSPNPTTQADSSSSRSDTCRVFTGLTNGTRYYFRVTAVDGAGNESGYSNEVNAMPADRLAPLAPMGLQVVDSSSSTISINWRKNEDPDFFRYRVYRGVSSNPTTQVDSLTGRTDTSKTFAGLMNGTRYYFRVTAIDSSGNESAFSNEVNAMPADRIAPVAPAGLVVSDSSNTKISIRWRKNDDSDFLRYIIYRATSPHPATRVDSMSSRTDTAKTFSGLTNGVRYYFRVTAVDSAGNESAYSNEVNATPADRIAPAAPANLVVFDSSNAKIAIRWKQNTDSDFLRYRIYRSTSPNAITQVDSSGSPADTTKTFTGLLNGVRYYFRVTAVDSAGNESPYSNEVNAAPNLSLAVDDLNALTPKEYTLAQNFPNPFNPSTVIRYGVPARSRVTLEVFNILGQLVSRLVDDVQDAGFHETAWHADVPSGLYFYRIQAAELADGGRKFVEVRRMVLVK